MCGCGVDGPLQVLPSSSSTMGGLATLQTLATLTAVTLNVCPIFDEIPAIKRSRTTGDRSPLLFVAIWSNACLWIFYGIHTHAVHPIATTNITGFLSGSYFLSVFHSYAPPLAKVRLARAFTLAASLITLIGVYAFIFPSSSPSKTQHKLGAMCCLVTISVYAAPLSSVARALQLQSSKPISLFFALVGTLNAVLWSGYGLLTNDAWVYAPSVIGTILSVSQAAVFFWFEVVMKRGGKEGGREGGAGKRPTLSEYLMLGTEEGGKEGAAALL
ncbi:hypothetical protein VYU27_004313 [Nannochloropsis oceanica]